MTLKEINQQFEDGLVSRAEALMWVIALAPKTISLRVEQVLHDVYYQTIELLRAEERDNPWWLGERDGSRADAYAE